MAAITLSFLANDTIGIIGYGHLGRTIAEKLLEHGFPKNKLMLSYGGSSITFRKIKMAGLLENISDNKEVCRKSSIIFITVRPQAFKELKWLTFPSYALVVSCMAGISSDTLRKVLGIDVFRMMPSGPETIKANKGIVAVYPHNYTLTRILSNMGLRVYELPSEEMMHKFTVGVCLPAALIVARKRGLNTEQAVRIIEKEFPEFAAIYTWAKDVLPNFNSEKERDEYVEKMSTRGGVTEVIVDSLNSGNMFYDALADGIAKSKAIDADVR
jgi:pyrroline-5-carboxylate reductase